MTKAVKFDCCRLQTSSRGMQHPCIDPIIISTTSDTRNNNSCRYSTKQRRQGIASMSHYEDTCWLHVAL